MEAFSLQSEKVAARHLFRQARQSFASSAEGAAAAAMLKQNLKRLTGDLASVGTQVCLYRAFAEEANADLDPLDQYFFPRLNGDTLEFRRPRREDGFELNSFQIPEPIVNSSDALDPRRPVLVCCPAVAVDWQGGRIGMGKGYYDRFFDSHPKALRVGVVFHVQVSKNPLPAESWDQPLDWIVTEKMILRTSDRSP